MRLIFFFLLPLTILAMLGCAALEDFDVPPSDPEAPTTQVALARVTAVQADFYRFGPQQGTGPDQQLPRGTELRLVKQGSSYTQVETPVGTVGFVFNGDIQVVDHGELASQAEPRAAATGRSPGASAPAARVTGPQVNAPDSPLPDSASNEDLGISAPLPPARPSDEATRLPQFRY
ncbi:MAG: hypothetical protein ACFCU3_05815 [Verrucomicrobiales bacterium]